MSPTDMAHKALAWPTRLGWPQARLLLVLALLLAGAGCQPGQVGPLSGRLVGRVWHVDSVPAHGGQVVAMDRQTDAKYTTQMVDGGYGLSLPAGTYDLGIRLESSGATYYYGPITLPGSVAITYNVRLPDHDDSPQDTIWGRLTRADSGRFTGWTLRPASATCQRCDTAGLTAQSITLDSSGTFGFATTDTMFEFDLMLFRPDGTLAEHVDLMKLRGACYAELTMLTPTPNRFRHHQTDSTHLAGWGQRMPDTALRFQAQTDTAPAGGFSPVMALSRGRLVPDSSSLGLFGPDADSLNTDSVYAASGWPQVVPERRDSVARRTLAVAVQARGRWFQPWRLLVAAYGPLGGTGRNVFQFSPLGNTWYPLRTCGGEHVRGYVYGRSFSDTAGVVTQLRFTAQAAAPCP